MGEWETCDRRIRNAAGELLPIIKKAPPHKNKLTLSVRAISTPSEQPFGSALLAHAIQTCRSGKPFTLPLFLPGSTLVPTSTLTTLQKQDILTLQRQ